MSDIAVNSIYKPNHDETSRQSFVGAFKGMVNGVMEGELAQLYEGKLKHEFIEKNGHEPESREEVDALFADRDLYKLWGSLTYTSQDFLWEAVGQTIDRQRPEFEALNPSANNSTEMLGSLTLNPDLELPEPIGSAEIHRQPGGYFYEGDAEDLTSPLLYFSSIELYRKAKGLSTGANTGEPGMMHFIIQSIKEKFGDIQPKRILEIGCGVGTETIGLAQAFPDAEIHGLDLSAPFLRFGHLWAENQGQAIHFKQGNAADTGYPDGHFDLIVSHILFHETWHDMMPKIMTEAHRILATDGIFYNADVPYQPSQISVPKLATNSWQVEYNGEPFWAGFADSDIHQILNTSGFEVDQIFAEYVPLGAGQYFMFGGHKRGATEAGHE